jgi:hypothetical protein
VRTIPMLAMLAVATFAATTTLSCATQRAAPPTTETVSPADLVSSLADVATDRTAELEGTGLALKTIELKLVVGTERRGAARVSFLVLDADASSSSETSFTQTFVLELPPSGRRGAAAEEAASRFPAVREFVDAAIASARELAAAAERAGLPQKLHEVELTARIVRSHRFGGGFAFSGLGVGVGGSTSRGAEEGNTVRLVFASAKQAP